MPDNEPEYIPDEYVSKEDVEEAQAIMNRELNHEIHNPNHIIEKKLDHMIRHQVKDQESIIKLTKLFGDKLTEQGKDIQLLRAHLNRVNNAVIKLNTKFEDLELSDDSEESDHDASWTRYE